jgi:hypothetical protein
MLSFIIKTEVKNSKIIIHKQSLRSFILKIAKYNIML